MNSPVGIPAVAGETTEIVVLRPGGGRADVEMRAVATSWDDRPALLASLRDISVRREMEGRERQTHKMEAVGRLTAGIAHDFNNLLTTILGYSDLLLQGRPDDAELQEEVGEIRKASERAASLTRQLLAFSRKQVIDPRVLDLNALVVESSRMLRRLIGELAANGIGVILISSEMPELIGLADRILVMAGGRVTAELTRPNIDEAAILRHAMPQSPSSSGDPVQ